MNVLGAVINCISIGFAFGIITRTAPNLTAELVPLAGLLVLVTAVLILFEFSNLEPVTAEMAKSVRSFSTRAASEKELITDE
jgi:hypothetical protein